MSNNIDPAALDKLIVKCQDAMTNLTHALERGSVQGSKRYLSEAEILRDNLESKMTPEDRHKGADFLETKSSLDDAIVNASFKLDNLDNFSDRGYSNNTFGLFSGVQAREDAHVNEFDGLDFPSARAV